MKTKLTPPEVLQQIVAIQQMEAGKLCVIREGPDGPYYNLQYRENGKTVTRYVAQGQAGQVAANTANYQKFQGLVAEYAQQIIEKTRSERLAGLKKKTRSRNFSKLKMRKSSS